MADELKEEKASNGSPFGSPPSNDRVVANFLGRSH